MNKTVGAKSLANSKDKLNALIGSTITLAHAYYACNDKKNAVKYAKKTLELMKKDPTLKPRLHRIENYIKEME